MLGDTIDRIAAYRIAELPVGKAALYTAGFGLADALIAAVTRLRVPAIAAGPVVAFGAIKLGPVRKFLGTTGSEILGITAVAVSVDQALRIRERIRGLMEKVTGRIPTAGAFAGLGAPRASVPLASPQKPVGEYLTDVEEAIAAAATVGD